MNRTTIPVRDAMTANVVTIGPHEKVTKAADKMAKNNIGSLIIAEGNKPIGIITERDLLEKVVSSDLKASDIRVDRVMSEPLIKVASHEELFNAVRIMIRSDIRRLPVVEDDRLVGILTAQDVVEVSPRILEIMPEREEIRVSEEEAIEESVCEVCGEAKKPLREYSGKWICGECLDFLV